MVWLCSPAALSSLLSAVVLLGSVSRAGCRAQHQPCEPRAAPDTAPAAQPLPRLRRCPPRVGAGSAWLHPDVHRGSKAITPRRETLSLFLAGRRVEEQQALGGRARFPCQIRQLRLAVGGWGILCCLLQWLNLQCLRVGLPQCNNSCPDQHNDKHQKMSLKTA